MNAPRRFLVRSFGILAIFVAMLAVTASPAAADPDPSFPDCDGTWIGQQESCVPDACPDALNPGNQLPGTVCAVPAPVDACPDEALNPGIQAAGPCAVAAAVPDEAFVDPAIDVDRDPGALAYGAGAAPVDGGASAEVAGVTAAAAAPSAAAPTSSGPLPLTGMSIGSALYTALGLFLFGALAYGEAERASRRTRSVA